MNVLSKKQEGQTKSPPLPWQLNDIAPPEFPLVQSVGNSEYLLHRAYISFPSGSSFARGIAVSSPGHCVRTGAERCLAPSEVARPGEVVVA